MECYPLPLPADRKGVSRWPEEGKSMVGHHPPSPTVIKIS